jgi:Glycosyl transferase family 2
MLETKVICLTPSRNENWVIGIHLKAASHWSDQIIVADQLSDDGTRETVARYPKARLVDNCGKGHDDGERHRILLEAARAIPGRKILLTIDCDELLSANWIGSDEWKKSY